MKLCSERRSRRSKLGSERRSRRSRRDMRLCSERRNKSFIAAEGRMPNQRAGDVDERRLGQWTVYTKSKEVGTNSERDQLTRREIPLAFA